MHIFTAVSHHLPVSSGATLIASGWLGRTPAGPGHHYSIYKRPNGVQTTPLVNAIIVSTTQGLS